jgi:hypothetical protein
MGLAERAPTRLAEFTIGRRFAPTRWLSTLPRKGAQGREREGRPGVRRDDGGFRRDDTEKVVAGGIKLYYRRSIVEERSIGSHGHFS